MGLDLLDTPVRLTWDLHGPGAPLDDRKLLAIAGRIAEAGVFFVTLEEHPLTHPAIAALVRQLATGGCRLQVVCTGRDDELAALPGLSLPSTAVQLDVAAFLDGGHCDAAGVRQAVARLRVLGFEPTLCLIPQKTNLNVIPELLALCREFGTGRFKLPNARIGDTFPCCSPDELPRWQDLEMFRDKWQTGGPAADRLPELEIHDRFLWEIMTPGSEQSRSEYGGCQAANSLGHVDANGTVYACAAWPEALGSLLDTDLEQIWQSPQRHAVRERITRVPAGCAGCRDYALCLGGCRGLGVRLNASGGERDPMCREPRR